MKKLCIFLIAIFACHLNMAQDTIIKSNNEQIITNIIEITATEVKYKKFNFLDGPTYVEKKTDLQLIKYSNGNTENFQTTTPVPSVIKKQDSISVISQPVITDDYYQPEQVQSLPVGKAQDSVSKTTKKITTDDYYGATERIIASRPGRLSVSKKGFKHNENTITEKEFYTVLKQTNDKEIMSLVEKAGKAKKKQYIYFVCMVGNTTTLLISPVLYVVTQPAFIFPYFINRAVRKTSNKKAVELYNKKF